MLLVHLVGTATGEIRELPDRSDVAIVSSFGLAGQVQVFGESQAKTFREVGSRCILRTV